MKLEESLTEFPLHLTIKVVAFHLSNTSLRPNVIALRLYYSFWHYTQYWGKLYDLYIYIPLVKK